MIEVRRADATDPADADLLAAVGEVTVAAYAGFTTGPDDPYVARLRDARRRATEAELWVAVQDGRPLGSVTDCPPGSPWREVSGDGEGEYRMLSVDPAVRGRGVAQALVEHVHGRWRDAGATRMAISSLTEMHTAHRLYARLGYVRAPDRDWSPQPDVHLIVLTKELR